MSSETDTNAPRDCVSVDNDQQVDGKVRKPVFDLRVYTQKPSLIWQTLAYSTRSIC